MNFSSLFRPQPVSYPGFALAVGACLHLAAIRANADPSLLINEADPTTLGNDSSGFAAHDFVELRNTSATTKSLDGKSLVFYLGIDDLVYGAYSLDGFKIPASNGLLVVGGYGTPNADVVIGPNIGAAGSFLNLNPSAIALLDGAAENYLSPPANVSNLTLSKVSDALVYKPLNAALSTNQQKLLRLLTSGSEVNEGSGGDTNNDSMGRNPVGTARNTSTYKVGTPTPGTSNSETRPLLTFAWNSASNSIAENSASTLTGKITRSGSTTSALTVTLTNKDRSEWDLPETITIAAGSTNKTFTATPVDDKWKDGNQTVYFAATAASYGPTAGWAVVTDNPTDLTAKLIITEVHSHVFGDANLDGVTDGKDQFVELLNPSSTAAIDLSGFVIKDGISVLFTFPSGSILAPQSAAVVFGGGSNLVEGITTAFGGAMIFSKNSASLGLGEQGIVQIVNPSVAVIAGDSYPAGSEIAGMTYWPYPGGSNTVNPSNVLQIVGHSLVSGAVGEFSPGKKLTGTTYTAPTAELDLSYVTAAGVVTPTLSRLSPAGAVKLRIKLPGVSPTPLTYDLSIILTDTDSDDNAGILPGNVLVVTLPAGQTFVETDITPIATAPVLPADETYSYSVVRSAGFLNTTSPQNLKVVGTGHVQLTSLAGTIVESAGTTASIITFTLDSPEATPTLVNFSISPTSGPSALLPTTSITIPAGELTAIIPLDAVPGLLASGSQTLRITALAAFPVSKGNTVDVTVVDDAGLAQGPFINEVQTDPSGGVPHEFVELSAASGASLSGTYLVVYDAGGVATSVTALTGSTSAAGLYTVRGTGLPVLANSQTGTLNLPDTVGAVAVYRGILPTLPFNVTANGLLDAVVYGSASATVLQTLLPTVSYPPAATAGLLGDNGPITLDSVVSKTDVVGRSALGSAANNLRNPSNWRTFPYATAALSNFTAPVLTFTIPAVSRFAPAGTAQLTVSLPGAAEPLGYPLLVNLTDSDANNDALATVSSASILSGQTFVSVPLTSLRSPVRSSDEAVNFAVTAAESLTTPDPVTPASLLVKGNAGITFSPSATSIVESAGATSSVLALKLPSPVAAPTAFTLTLTGGSGAVLAQSTVTIASGDTAVVAVDSVGGTLAAGSELLTATFYSTTPADAALGSDTTITVVDDAGIPNGPFLNEIEADPLNGNNYEYIELVVPTNAVTPLSGLTLVVYDLNGNVLQTVPLTGSTNLSGFYLIRDTALPGGANSQVAALDLPDAAGAVALYRTSSAPSVLTSDNLLDAIVYGSGTSDSLRKALLPQVTYPTSAGLLTGKNSTLGPAEPATLSVLARTGAVVNAGDFRNPPDWSPLSYGTPGLANSASSYPGWGAAFGLNSNSSDFTNATFIPPLPAPQFPLPVAPDADKDGVPDWLEFITGTNPILASSHTGWIATPGHSLPTPVPHIFSITLNPIALGDTAHFAITAESSTTLAPPWTDETWTVAPTVAAPVGAIHVPSTPDPIPARKFYRLKVVSTP